MAYSDNEGVVTIASRHSLPERFTTYGPKMAGTFSLSVYSGCGAAQAAHMVSIPRYVMAEPNELNTEKLLSDIKVVASDAEAILRETASLTGDNVAILRARIDERLQDLKVHLADAQASLVERGKSCACTCNSCVRENPWQSVGIATVVGLAVGIIIGRR